MAKIAGSRDLPMMYKKIIAITSSGNDLHKSRKRRTIWRTLSFGAVFFAAKKLKIKAKIKIKYTKNEAFRTHADIAKAKNLLGYEPKVSFNEGIDLFLDWHKKYEK